MLKKKSASILTTTLSHFIIIMDYLYERPLSLQKYLFTCLLKKKIN